MADNIAAKSDATTTVGTLAADDIGGVLYMRNKLVHGADGVNAGDVSAANPLPTVDSAGNTSLASIDTKTPALGQALAAASVPVVLPAAQITTLTPPAAITGYATAAKQPALGTAGTPSSDVITVQGITNGTAQNVAQSGTWTVQPGNTANTTAWKVDASSVAVPITDNSGSLTVDAPVGTPVFVRLSDGSSAITSLQVTGSTAHDAVDANNPLKCGYKATTALSGLTLVANADRTDGYAGIDGVQIVRPHCNLEDVVSGVSSITDGSSTSTIAAQGAGVKTYITSVVIANTSATAVTVDLRDGAAGTVKATFPVPANTSGVVCNLPVPLGFSANTAVCADPSAAASTVVTTLIGFKSKV